MVESRLHRSLPTVHHRGAAAAGGDDARRDAPAADAADAAAGVGHVGSLVFWFAAAGGCAFPRSIRFRVDQNQNQRVVQKQARVVQ